MKCPFCGNTMKNMMHFENSKNYAYHECPKCHTRTHQKRIHFETFEKGNSNENSSHSKKV